MPADLKPVTGPIPVYARTTPTAVVLDLEALTQCVVSDVIDVIDALLDPANTGPWDRLHELADLDMADMPQAPMEGRLLTEELVADLTARSSSRVPLTVSRARDLGTTLRMLADRLTAAGQQGRRAA
ncbi:hypothetical protein OG909_24915 [Streptomyces sp. NBC_01754]|uniref:hypothetical protein n=1 Tax=Streptomyces sp. NBC_01754 TaxID=2975930 RepID=UPI002DDABE67|nr:hypothetical protein [Streptomyces sp. NBC_01754]WSC95257.1 hypothetical protein OG909_24915 [Streptomyces sp. NBC_01754]